MTISDNRRLDNEISWTAETQGLTARSFLPSKVTLEMTYSCSHSCVFCSCPWYAASRKFGLLPEQSAEDSKKMIDVLVDECGVSSITFSGGEPLLNPSLREIALHASKKRAEHFAAGPSGGATVKILKPPSLSIVTNGSPLDEGWLDFLAGVGASVAISLPGLSTYALHTGSPGADYHHALRMIGESKKRGMMTTASITVTRANFREIYETFAEALLAGADYLLINRFMPGGRGLSYIKELLLDGPMTAEMLATAEDVLKTAGRNGGIGTEIPKCFFHGMRFERLAARSGCSGALDFFAVDPSGYIRVCTHSDERLVHYSEYKKLSDNATWKSFSKREYLPPECSPCSEKFACNGGCRAAAAITGGSLDCVDPVFKIYDLRPEIL